MTANTYTLARRNGAFFVRWTDIFSSQPTGRNLFWRVVRVDGWMPCEFRAESEGSDYCAHCGQHGAGIIHTDKTAESLSYFPGTSGMYAGRLGGSPFKVYIDPRQDAEIVETFDVPCPKVRKGTTTRFSGGRWQKYTASRGWATLNA